MRVLVVLAEAVAEAELHLVGELVRSLQEVVEAVDVALLVPV